jgi:pSer/pThr/pTyr-binding forkhead associated (FHA) protein
MDVKLVLHKGKSQQRICSLHHQPTLVGRRRDCHLRILSVEVSRRHCLLSIDSGYVSVQDLDSSNGTFVNGKRVDGK